MASAEWGSYHRRSGAATPFLKRFERTINALYDNPLVLLVAGFVGLWLFVSLVGAMSILSLRGVHLVPLSREKTEGLLQRVLPEGPVGADWVEEQGFEPAGAYRATGMPGEPQMVTWVHRRQRAYLCLYDMPDGRLSFDFVTMFEGPDATDSPSGVVTGNLSDGMLVPWPPGFWNQCFSSNDAEQQWRQHEDAIAYLTAKRGVTVAPAPCRLIADFTETVKAQVRHVRSIPLWWLRIPYWYFVRKNRLYNKSVEELDTPA